MAKESAKRGSQKSMRSGKKSDREMASALGSIAGSYVEVEAIPDEPTQEEHEKRFEENVRSDHFDEIRKLGGAFKDPAEL